ncbi:hypothetical protein K9N68_26995 [Kovacikia minuta CCNUW1]|nr:hypothetical protein [Kovacikia minuta]UBF29678.1 hypothetical protein K9N68_26995 [Kovacikia minuta CCNUW1]
MVALSLLIGVMLWGGERTAPWVREFSWQGKQVGADDTAFLLTFSRPMDHASVESNLRIEPPLPGKVSWAGRRMAYTLMLPAPYGTEFRVQLEGAKERFGGAQGTVIQPFTGQFRSRDRAFAYIGVEGEEEGRLVLYNLNQQQKQILTPKELVVMEFKAYPLGDCLLFAAVPRTAQPQGLLEQQLYTVTTGIHVEPPVQLDNQTSGISAAATPPTPPGKVELVLDSNTHQNLRFDLSTDGKIIVVQRVNRNDPADFGPWLLKAGEPPTPLKGQPGGDFLITPDSSSLAISQGQGLAILPLQPEAKPLNFLPKFGMVLNFSQDGSLAAMVKFNTDRTRSLFLVTSQGTQKQLLRTTGSILNAQFDPTRQTLYCLLTELNTEGNLYREEPYLAAIDLKTSKLSPLLRLPDQRDVQLSLAPDGLAILFDQTTRSTQTSDTEPLRDSSGKAIANSRLWLLPINPTAPTTNIQPEALPLPGLRPRWLP